MPLRPKKERNQVWVSWIGGVLHFGYQVTWCGRSMSERAQRLRYTMDATEAAQLEACCPECCADWLRQRWFGWVPDAPGAPDA